MADGGEGGGGQVDRGSPHLRPAELSAQLLVGGVPDGGLKLGSGDQQPPQRGVRCLPPPVAARPHRAVDALHQKGAQPVPQHHDQHECDGGVERGGRAEVRVVQPRGDDLANFVEGVEHDSAHRRRDVRATCEQQHQKKACAPHRAV